ncbi:TasA family protein [Bacillus sp. JJ1533]|uniref:TasA family protein n=1 Tax=Bacillus sp. JJ1533 TaxID=3122959 RepID=UPI002FFF5FC9
MKMKKKLLGFTLGATVLAGTIIGGTFAYFNSTETSTGNNFSSGTLSLQSMRNDLPTNGPMFYTESGPDGVSGTGLWKPGDAHTRGLFIENTGTLDALLKTVSASPEATVGTDAFNDAMKFAEQSIATISILEPVNGEGTFDSTTYAEMLNEVNEWFNLQFDYYWYLEASKEGDLDPFEGITLAAEIIDNIEQQAQNKVFTVSVTDMFGNTSTIEGKIADIINEQSLKDLVTNGVNVSSENLTVTTGEQMYFAYTIKFLDLDPEVNNPLQGKEINFGFSSEFIAK